ncbi:MAG: cell division protein FtsQ/DivIB [Candidatus Omnitrophica bacterium]|nr:cell division protein FtsQ/DivIB [Candidatus Omnitrophota bacterium]
MPDYKRLVKKRNNSKRVTKVSPRSKKILAKIFMVFLLIALITGLVFFGYSFLLRFPGFAISKLIIVDENFKPVAQPNNIFRLENLTNKPNLFSFDLRKVAGDIRLRHPELANLVVRRQFPNAIIIMVTPRKPVAIISLRESYLVDAQGFILPYVASGAELPKIVGLSSREIRVYSVSDSLRLNRALSLLRELERSKIYPEHQLTQIDIREYSDVVFYLDSGIQVKMGGSDFSKKVILLKGVLQQLKSSATAPKYIDMRFDNPSVLF